ncbi:MAG: phenylalanine--tRNA ligase beta subunit-related protein [Pseudomonadota bacterium]
MVSRLETSAKVRIGGGTESEFAEIQAWRQAYAKMGFKPTKVRCASEALLRRLRQHGSLPRLHPLVDLCNAKSALSALPVAAFDLAKIAGDMKVCHATGQETYLTFGGELETPEAGEVIFRDHADNVHARRWVNRQSGLSAIQTTTTDALIVIEGLHETANDDVAALRDQLAEEISRNWKGRVSTGQLVAGVGVFRTDGPSRA